MSDISTYFDEIRKKIGKLNRLLKSCEMDEDLTRYLPEMNRLKCHGLIYFAKG